MVDVSGLIYVMDAKFVDKSKLRVLYDFRESGAILNKAPNFLGQFSGILDGPNSFYYGSGTGYPTANVVSIENEGNLYTGNWTHIFLISRSGQANDNFFSSLAANSGSVSSGYLITSNNVGKLIFSYADCQGNQSVASNFTLNPNASFAVTKNNNTLSFFQYTPIFNLLDSDSHQVNSSQIFKSDYADLFLADKVQAGFIKDYYSGLAYGYAYFTAALSPNQLSNVFSGFYTTLTTSGGVAASGGADCSGFFTLAEPLVDVPTVEIPTPISLNKQGIVLLKPFPNNGTIVIDYDTGNAQTSWNNQAAYDYSRGNFALNSFSSIPPIVYLNGQRVISGINEITGQFCATGKVWEFDYTYSGNIEVDDAASYDINDTLIYDIPRKHTWQQLHSGTGSVILTDSAKVIGYYLNGQRTKDFTVSGTTLTPTVPRTSGDIVVVDYYDGGYGIVGEVHASGYFFTSGNFAQGTSRVYLNGVRQLLGQDYLEVNQGSLLVNSPLNQPNVIVANIDNYLLWNI